MMSSERFTVPLVFIAPTVIAYGEFPGDVMPPRIGAPSAALPEFPAEAITTMPSVAAFMTATQSGSVTDGSVTGCPSDRLIARMLYRRVVLDDPFDAGDDIAGPPGAVGAEHAHVDELDVGRNAAPVHRRHVPGRGAVARDDPGDMRAVPMRIVSRRIARHLADIRNHFSIQRGMRRDARVDRRRR